MIFKDYYKILGLESTRVSINEIKIAYRAVAKKYHPDVNIGDTLAEERIKDINEAYRILVNPQTKKSMTEFGIQMYTKRKELLVKVIDKQVLFLVTFSICFSEI